jgi:hypothetical protein
MSSFAICDENAKEEEERDDCRKEMNCRVKLQS